MIQFNGSGYNAVRLELGSDSSGLLGFSELFFIVIQRVLLPFFNYEGINEVDLDEDQVGSKHFMNCTLYREEFIIRTRNRPIL